MLSGKSEELKRNLYISPFKCCRRLATVFYHEKAYSSLLFPPYTIGRISPLWFRTGRNRTGKPRTEHKFGSRRTPPGNFTRWYETVFCQKVSSGKLLSSGRITGNLGTLIMIPEQKAGKKQSIWAGISMPKPSMALEISVRMAIPYW